MKRKALFGLLFLGACGGSAKHTATPVAKEPAREALPPGTVVVMPIASDKYPRLAAALDRSLKGVHLRGMVMRISSVPMDTVQLQLECTEETTTCYAAVARSLSADSLLFASVDADGAAVMASVHLTTSDGSEVKGSGATYKTEDAAVAEADHLVDSVLEGMKE